MAHRRTPGEGSIIRRKDGRWQASLQLDGMRKTVYGKTRGEVVQKLEDLRCQAVTSGALPSPGRRTLNDLLDVYLTTKRADLKRSTAEHYELLANTYIRPAMGMSCWPSSPPTEFRCCWGNCGTAPGLPS